MDVFNAYSYATASWLAVQAIPLLLSPKIIITFLSPDVHQPTSLEQYFARCLGFALLNLGIMSLFFTGVFPVAASSSSADGPASASTFARPTVILTMCYHSSMAFYTYTWFIATHQFAFVFATIFSATLAAVGLWTLMFGEGSRISKRTGADKRTSGFPFGNAEANKRKAGKIR